MDPKTVETHTTEPNEIENALVAAYDACENGRERIGMEARALRAALRTWLDTVIRETREAEAMLEGLEGWSAGARLPDFAGQLVDAVSGREGRNSIPETGLENLMFHLILEAARYERPEYGHVLDLEEATVRPPLSEWRREIARTVAAQAEQGFGDITIPSDIKGALRKAFISALRRPKNVSEEDRASVVEVEAAE